MLPMNEQIVALAKEQGISPDSFKKWRGRGFVPHRYRLPLLQAAADKGVQISGNDFEWKPQKKRRAKKRRAA